MRELCGKSGNHSKDSATTLGISKQGSVGAGFVWPALGARGTTRVGERDGGRAGGPDESRLLLTTLETSLKSF